MLQNPYFRILMNVVNLGLLCMGFYYGVIKSDYAQASFNLLLVLINRDY